MIDGPLFALPRGTLFAALTAFAGVLLMTLGGVSVARWRFLDKRIREYVTFADQPPPSSPAEPTRTAARVALGARLQRRLAGVSLLARLGALITAPRRAKRRAAFERQLPQAIDAMAGSLQAGSTLTQAMAVLAREMPEPLSGEFRHALREMEVGLTFPDALAGLQVRVPSSDLTLFVSAITVQQRVGGDLAAIFRSISHTIRERQRVRGEMRVLTAQARYSSFIIAGLPVLLFAFLWFTNFSYLSVLFQPGLPRILFIGAIGSVALGFFTMNKLATVDV